MSGPRAHIDLSPFQSEKLEYYFKFLEPNEDGMLESHSVDRLMERIRLFTGWSKESSRYLQCLEIHKAFFEILFEKAVEEGGEMGSASLENWLAIWRHILCGCKGMSNFPIWLRLMPKVLFEVIDRDGDHLISPDELANFYKGMVSISQEEVEEVMKSAYKNMTDDGRYPLDLESYEQIFANFLIGKTPYGPGKYIFGCFEHTDETPFQLIKPMPDEEESTQSKNIRMIKQKRPKLTGKIVT